MKQRSLFSVLAVLLVLSLVLGACAVAAPAPAAAPAAEAPAAEAPAVEAPAADPMTFVLVPKNLGNPYFDTANNGAQEAAAELGVTVLYQGSSAADATQQIQLINSLIAQKVNGLAIAANDSDALVPTGKDAMDAGIPVVSWDSAIGQGGRVLHINQAVLRDIGAIEIQMALDLAPDGGQIAILSATSTAPNQNAWIEVMKEELAKPEYANLDPGGSGLRRR